MVHLEVEWLNLEILLQNLTVLCRSLEVAWPSLETERPSTDRADLRKNAAIVRSDRARGNNQVDRLLPWRAVASAKAAEDDCKIIAKGKP